MRSAIATPSGYTNWLAAIAEAQRQLEIAAGSHSGLSAARSGSPMVRSTSRATVDDRRPRRPQRPLRAARSIPQGAAPTPEYGIFNAFREAGVVVMGTLARARAPTADRRRAGDVAARRGHRRTTAVQRVHAADRPIPDGAAHGACRRGDQTRCPRAGVPRARQPDRRRLSRCRSTPEGRFWIDPGVARFRIASVRGLGRSRPLRVRASARHGDRTACRRGCRLPAGATHRRGRHHDPELARAVAARRAETRRRLLFSDLAIVFDDAEHRSNVGRATARPTRSSKRAGARCATAQPAPLDVYGSARSSTACISHRARRLAQQLPAHEVDPATGAITIPLPAECRPPRSWCTAIDSISDLTEPHGLALAPVTDRSTRRPVLPAPTSLGCQRPPMPLTRTSKGPAAPHEATMSGRRADVRRRSARSASRTIPTVTSDAARTGRGHGTGT